MYTKRTSKPRAWCVVALALALGAFAGSALADPPARVARVGYLQGNVSFQPAGDNQWAQVSLNRPLMTGDKLYTDRDSRIELQIGSADIRLDDNSTFDLLNLDDNTAQMELTEGVLDLHVRRLGNGQSYEIDTPTLAFVVNQPGNYRIDIDPQGNSSMVTVFDGGGDVYGENNASYSVRGGSSYRFNDSALRDYEVLDLPNPDDFDRWCQSRDTRLTRSVSSRYVADDVIGYSDLDDYGSWSSAPSYGNVWYPTQVAADWAPYRSGYWSWVDPWGWTWIDSNPWGFAPFHYGRWAYIGNRWGWCPGPRTYGAVYAPALVAFVGGGGWGANISIGGGGPVGWFPLGPRDVYVPWYQASRSYFTNVNVRNTTVINNTYITNVYNNYSTGRPIGNINYAYQRNTAAVTAVSRDTFVGARSVVNSRVAINESNLRNAQVVSRIGIAPTQASFIAAGAERSRVVPQAAVLNRNVIARTAPPPPAAPIATRVQAIERNNAQPLATSQLREIAAPAAVAAGAVGAAAIASRVRVVGQGNAQRPQPLPARAPDAGRQGVVNNERANPAAGARPAPTAPAMPANRAPATAPGNEARTQTAPAREALPSSRFAPRNNATTTEQRSVPSQNRGNPATQMQNRAPTNAETRAQPSTMPSRAQPAERAAPRTNTESVAQPRTFQNERPAQSRSNTQQTSQPAEQRSAPRASQQYQPRNAPQQEYQQPRSVQQQQYQQQRATPQPQERAQPRQQEYQQPRAAPQQQYQQPRAMPQPQERAQPQQQRPQPPQRRDEKDKKDNEH